MSQPPSIPPVTTLLEELSFGCSSQLQVASTTAYRTHRGSSGYCSLCIVLIQSAKYDILKCSLQSFVNVNHGGPNILRPPPPCHSQKSHAPGSTQTLSFKLNPKSLESISVNRNEYSRTNVTTNRWEYCETNNVGSKKERGSHQPIISSYPCCLCDSCAVDRTCESGCSRVSSDSIRPL